VHQVLYASCRVVGGGRCLLLLLLLLLLFIGTDDWVSPQSHGPLMLTSSAICICWLTCAVCIVRWAASTTSMWRGAAAGLLLLLLNTRRNGVWHICSNTQSVRGPQVDGARLLLSFHACSLTGLLYDRTHHSKFWKVLLFCLTSHSRRLERRSHTS
jgi:hypothetical protein